MGGRSQATGVLTAAERRNESVMLRTAGASYREIGRQLGISHEQAFQDVKAGLASLHEELKTLSRHYLALELQRLEFPLLKLLPLVNAGNPAAIDQWRKLSESRRRLLGIDKARLRIMPDLEGAKDELAELLGLAGPDELPE
jgi:DNA-binding CsgD family transcriptional regulator